MNKLIFIVISVIFTSALFSVQATEAEFVNLKIPDLYPQSSKSRHYIIPLENQLRLACANKELKIRKVHKESQRYIRSIIIKDNLLYDMKIKAPANGNYFYVQNLDFSIKATTLGTTHHDELATNFEKVIFKGSARDVLCAGEIVVSKGKLTSLSNRSGHYFPSAYHLFLFSSWLKEKSAALEGNTKIEIYTESIKNKPKFSFDAVYILKIFTREGIQEKLKKFPRWIPASLTIPLMAYQEIEKDCEYFIKDQKISPDKVKSFKQALINALPSVESREGYDQLYEEMCVKYID